MPIVLQTNATQTPTYSPKFFSDILTGNGKGQGLLNSKLDRVTDRLKAGSETKIYTAISTYSKPSVARSSSHEIHTIPLTHLRADTSEADIFAEAILQYQSARDTFLVYTITSTNGSVAKWYSIPLSVVFQKPFSKNGEKILTIRYLHVKEIDDLPIVSSFCESASPFYPIAAENNADPNGEADYSVHGAITKMSELMQVHFVDITKTYIDGLIKRGITNDYNLFKTLYNLTDFQLTFEHYSELFDEITRWSKNANYTVQKRLEDIILSNVNLLMLDSVHNLKADKPSHARTITPATPPATADFLSPAQREAVVTDDAFVLVQAGAGSGKSTTIIERIRYMEDTGIEPQNIRVLSLTNAAADNILSKNDKIQSMTIAKYISEIYRLNYPNQELVDYQTLKNTAMIYAGHLAITRDFTRLLKEKDNIDLLKFIRDNFDDVVQILDLTKQTTLQIQAYISYLKAETFDYGDDVANHFIVDETQDNNVFEFIYLMKIAALRKASIYIVGDASQTLYEFRGASSQALNAIETSGIFSCIKLDVNYRSNQYVLDFANTVLADIDVNRFAQIQLQANELSNSYKHEFQNTVHLKPIEVEKFAEFDEYFDDILAMQAATFIRQKVEDGEKVAILARQGKDVQKLQAWAERVFSDKTVTNLVPKRSYASTLFSTYIRSQWEALRLTPNTNIVDLIAKDIDAKLIVIYKSKADFMRTSARYQINDWVRDEGKNVRFLEAQYKAGKINRKDFMDKVRDNMIQYEIRNNVIRQSLLRQEQDKTDKETLVEQSDILISTVHSVKGLEFDNVVYLHRNGSSADSEEEKRIDYVALTRAKKAELVLDVYVAKSYSKFNYNYQNLLENYQ